MEKMCKYCKEVKPLSEFPKNRLCTRDGHTRQCKSCTNKKALIRDPKNLRTSRSHNSLLKRKYGITLDEYEAMYQKQDGRCAICSETVSYKLAVDHNHTTGAVRGLLCKKCNLGIGNLRDDVSLVLKAAQYLEKYESIS